MTLPINYKLPELNKDKSPEETTSYLQDLTYELQNMYEKTAQNVNGVFRSSLEVDGSQFIPTLAGNATPATFTYTRQAAYVLRQGIMVDFWFDISWTSIGAGTGALVLNLPYRVTKHASLFFTGVCYMENTTFGAGRTATILRAFPDTFRAGFRGYGVSVNLIPIPIYSSGGVGGHLRYIGVEDE